MPIAILTTTSWFRECLAQLDCRDIGAAFSKTDKSSCQENDTGTAFEIALICDIKLDLPSEVIDTLVYMTREEDYDFDTKLEEGIFLPDEDEGYPPTYWRHIISNISAKETIERNGLSGDRISLFAGGMLCFRHLVGDDELYNAFFPFIDWLAKIGDTIPYEVVGTYVDILSFQPQLICFYQNRFVERDVIPDVQEFPTSLRWDLFNALGGIGEFT